MTPPGAGPRADDIETVTHEGLHRAILVVVTIGPFVALGAAAWQTWNELLSWHDLLALALMYLLTTAGVTVGFHRLLTHRAFETSPALRGVLAALGSASVEGPVISWVADHRKHHAFTDEEGDPHSPHVGHGDGLRGTLRGLFYAHLGWLFIHTQRGSRERFAKDLLNDPVVRFVDRTFFLWVLAGLAVPFGLGIAIGGTVTAGLTALLWGGAVRMLVVHHLTYSINSLCHTFGRRPYETDDASRNLAWLALPTLGEAWHNNHHAFPTSAVHGVGRRQLDPSALLIGALERIGLVWNVVRISPERLRAKAA
jgi:stearoyl-CoA desaturase (delta-9 desaturase)